MYNTAHVVGNGALPLRPLLPRLLLALLAVLSCMPEPPMQPITQVVGPEGGRVVSNTGIVVDIPEGALSAQVPITISTAYYIPSGSIVAAEINPTGTKFLKPITLSFPHGSASPETLKVMTVLGGAWSALPGWAVDTERGLVSGTTTHLSPYGLVPSNETCANEFDDDGDELIDCEDPFCAGQGSCLSEDGGMSEDGGTTKCVHDKHCPTGQICVDRVCINGPADGGGLTDAGAPPDAGDIVDAGAVADAGDPADAGTKPCHSHNQCATGEICLDAVCVMDPLDGGTLTCQSDAECPDGLRCRGFRCK